MLINILISTKYFSSLAERVCYMSAPQFASFSAIISNNSFPFYFLHNEQASYGLYLMSAEITEIRLSTLYLDVGIC